jgi:hypothetical protein
MKKNPQRAMMSNRIKDITKWKLTTTSAGLWFLCLEMSQTFAKTTRQDHSPNREPMAMETYVSLVELVERQRLKPSKRPVMNARATNVQFFTTRRRIWSSKDTIVGILDLIWISMVPLREATVEWAAD